MLRSCVDCGELVAFCSVKSSSNHWSRCRNASPVARVSQSSREARIHIFMRKLHAFNWQLKFKHISKCGNQIEHLWCRLGPQNACLRLLAWGHGSKAWIHIRIIRGSLKSPSVQAPTPTNYIIILEVWTKASEFWSRRSEMLNVSLPFYGDSCGPWDGDGGLGMLLLLNPSYQLWGLEEAWNDACCLCKTNLDRGRGWYTWRELWGRL